MKKLLLTTLLALSGEVWANAQYSATETCIFDYDDFDFCSKQNIAKYKEALKTKQPNFANKYILINLGTLRNIRYVAIDSKNGLVIPLGEEIIGFKDDHYNLTGKPPTTTFSISSANLCVKGSVYSYRNAYDNISVCFSIKADQFSNYGVEFSRNGSPEPLSN